MGLFFGNKAKLQECENKVKELEKKLASKEKEIQNLLIDLEEANKLSPKQVQIFEKNYNICREENKKYKFVVDAYRLNPDRPVSVYRVELDKLFPKNKELIALLNEKNIFFLDEISVPQLANMLNDDFKNREEILKKLDDFHSNKISWEILTYINKGEKISKIFSKYRKFCTALAVMNIEYMDEIAELDILSLKNQNFNLKQIEEILKLRDEYYAKTRTVINLK